MTDWRPVRGRLTVFGSYIVLTEPVPELLAEIGWTGGEAIVDARMFLHYFRTTNDGRVLMGSGSGPIGRGNRIDRRFTHDAATAGRAELGLRRLLPGLAAARVERAWGGPIDVSADHLPFIGTAFGTQIHYAAGYSGNGVGPSWLAGQALGSLATNTDDEYARLPLVNRRGQARPARADPLPGRRSHPSRDPRVRGSRRSRPPRPPRRPSRGRPPPPARNGPRHALKRPVQAPCPRGTQPVRTLLPAVARP